MKALIYIGGPITDNRTGKPREGWQEDFRKAEVELRDMGFEVVNPVDLSRDAEELWRDILRSQNGAALLEHLGLDGAEVPRWLYIRQCVNRICQYHGFGRGAGDMSCGRSETVPLIGVYVLGAPEDVLQSYGTMCEINLALAAGLRVWSQHFGGAQVNNLMQQRASLRPLAEVAKLLKEDYYAGTDARQSRKLLIIGEERLEEDVKRKAAEYPDDRWELDALKESLVTDNSVFEGDDVCRMLCMNADGKYFRFKAVLLTPDAAVFSYHGISAVIG